MDFLPFPKKQESKYSEDRGVKSKQTQMRGFLLCVLKLLNFVLLVSGISLVIYSGWVYKEWKKETAEAPSPSVDLTYGTVPLVLPSIGSFESSQVADGFEWDTSVPW